MSKCLNFGPSLSEQTIVHMGFKIGHFEVCLYSYYY